PRHAPGCGRDRPFAALASTALRALHLEISDWRLEISTPRAIANLQSLISKNGKLIFNLSARWHQPGVHPRSLRRRADLLMGAEPPIIPPRFPAVRPGRSARQL